MGVLQRFERRLEDLVGGTFARLFKGQVEPVEIAKALQREADENRAVIGGGRVLVPNRYIVELGPSDHARLAPWESQLTRTLAEMVQEFVDGENWSTYGDISVSFALDKALRTGMFRVGSDVDFDAGPRQRPRDSLSMPIPDAERSGGPPPYQPQQPPPQQYEQPRYDQQQPQYGQPQYEQPQLGVPSVPQPAVPPMPMGPPMGVPPMAPQQYEQQQPPPQQYEQPQRYEQPQQYEQPPTFPPQQYAQPQYEQQPLYDAQPQPVLVLDGTDRRYPVRPGSTMIGRGQDADVRLADTGVSRRHAVVRFDGTTAVIEDLESTNGTVVNGQRIRTWRLQSEDVIRVGHTVIVFRQEPATR